MIELTIRTFYISDEAAICPSMTIVLKEDYPNYLELISKAKTRLAEQLVGIPLTSVTEMTEGQVKEYLENESLEQEG